MRSIGVAMIALAAGCRFDLPAASGDAPGSEGPSSAIPFKKRLTIDPARVTGAQPQFPVWISIVDDADLRAHATDGGTDIYFTNASGAPLPYQIQRWTRSSGWLEAWVSADLDDLASTTLELRYGDPGRAAAPNPSQVFSNAFVAVWHLDDMLDTNAVADAVGLHPGATGGLGPTDRVTAQLGSGIDFDGTSQRVNFTLPLTGNGDHTISAWVNQRTATGFDSIVTMGNPVMNQSRVFHSHFTSGLLASFYGNDWSSTLPNIDNAGWVLLHWTYRGANRLSHVYRNGADLGSFTFAAGVNTQGLDGNLGYAPMQWGPGGTEPCALNGILDEVRIATVERSASWIATEYANQTAPQTFYAIGAEERVLP